MSTSTRRIFNFLIPFILFMACTLLPAQDTTADEEVESETVDPGPFYGFWEFKEPAGDTCVVIIKRGGRLSCFWAGTATRAIQKGTWRRTGSILTARWDTGYIDVFKKLGENAIERSSFNEGASLLDDPFLKIRGVRVDSRIPGSLTVEREDAEPRQIEEIDDPQTAPAIPIHNAFIGYWKINQDKGLFGLGSNEPFYYLHLERSGNASVSLRDWEGDKAVRGTWRIDGDQAVVRWPNNRRDVLHSNPKGDGFQLSTYKPKAKPGSKPQDTSKAEKMLASDAERFFGAGNFKRLTVEDIRGTWYPAEADSKSEYISVEGWANAYRYPAADGGAGTDPGKWHLQNDRLEITWVDGTKDIIRISPQGFIQESFTKAEPFNGTPYRSIRVILREE